MPQRPLREVGFWRYEMGHHNCVSHRPGGFCFINAMTGKGHVGKEISRVMNALARLSMLVVMILVRLRC